MRESQVIGPVLKWVGGKRQLLREILPRVETVPYTRYVEPFFGGGAVFFSLLPEKAVINDYNRDLINVYRVIKEDVEALISCLAYHAEQNSKEYYYEVRNWDRTESYHRLSAVERAARFLYLNKTCYNGLFRVNSKGQFNVPFGRYKHPNIVNAEMLRVVSAYFREKEIQIENRDYRDILEGVKAEDFVYLDPPYMPISSSSSFTSYTEQGFGYEEQVALKEACDALRSRGIPFLQSNSDCPEIRELYKEYDLITVRASRSVNSQGAKRGKINEVLISYGI